MSRSDRKAWRENKRANHRRNEERRWDRRCAFAFGSLWVPDVLPLRRQAVDGCIPRQMMTGPESGNSYAQAAASGKASGFIVIDELVTKHAMLPEAIERARSWFDETIKRRSVQ